MKKMVSVLLAALLILGSVSLIGVTAAEEKGAPADFATQKALYVHAVTDSADTEAWQAWQSVHDEDFEVAAPQEKYFFLPSSADKEAVDVYNGFDEAITLNGVSIASHATEAVPYEAGTAYTVAVAEDSYTLTVMNSNAEAAIYINNPDADGDGTELMAYLNADKSNSAKATGAIVTPDGKIDNTTIKKIKGRGNTSWDKPKKGYNITYDKKVGIAGMEKNKKFSILPNYQDDSLSRNRFLYDLSDAVGMPYASDSRYVDFYANGYYWGSYLMAEKVEAGSLVTDVDEEAYLNEDGSVKEDFPFIVEVDASAGDDDYWVSSNGLKLTIKAPEIDPGAVGYNEVKSYVQKHFNEFYTATSSTSNNLSEVADIESVAKLYLINELGKNWDSGVSSTFFTYKQDRDGVYKFYGSPVWDYDNSLGNAVGIERELSSIGVSDYEEYTGWWCKFKGKSGKRSSNVIARIAQNKEITEALPEIWFEDFKPAIDHFSGETSSEKIDRELMTRDGYFELIEGSAEMNYTSGWLLNTGAWIADHSTLYKATYDSDTKKMVVSDQATAYSDTFKDMYDYTADWMIGRAAWLSEQFAPDYNPKPFDGRGDADRDGALTILDATHIQRYMADLCTEDEIDLIAANVDGDEDVSILDATRIQRVLADLCDMDGNPIAAE